MTVIGTYPCCGAPLMLAMPDRTPAYLPEDCPHCGAKVWHKFCRLDPESWTEADFLEEFEVDPVAMTIVPRRPLPPAPEPGTIQEKVMAAFREVVFDSLLYGTSRAGSILPLPGEVIIPKALAAEFMKRGKR